MYPAQILMATAAAGKNDLTLVVMVFICLALLAALLLRNGVLSRQRRLLRESEEALRVSEEQYRIAMRHSNLNVFRFDVNNRTAYVDDNLAKKYMLPYELTCVPDSLILAGMIHRESVDDFDGFFARMKNGEATGDCVVRINDPDNIYKQIWYRFEYTLVENDASRYAIIIYDDYTQKRENLLANKRLEREIEMLDLKRVQVLEYNLTLDSCLSARGDLLEMDMSGDMPLNQRVEQWARHNIHRDDVLSYIAFVRRDRLLTEFGDGVREQCIDFRAFLSSKEDYHWIRLTVHLQIYPGSDDVIMFAVYRDIHEVKTEELALRALSEEDPLTGVYNRMTFERRVRGILDGGGRLNHALIMIDMDGFKNVNDTFGHAAGDRVLINAANSIRSMLRGGDLVGRIGGDEFMVLLRDIPKEDVARKRAQLLNEMLHSFIGDGVSVSASLGIAIYPRDGSSFESLYYSADMAVYHAKHHGRNRCAFYTDSMKNDTALIEPTPIERFASEGDMSDVQKRQVEQILQENEMLLARQEEDDRYRIVIEKLGIATFEWDEINNRFSSSALFEQFTLSEQSGRVLFEDDVDVKGVHPDDVATFTDGFIRKFLRGKGVESADVRLRLKTGEYVPCRLRAIVIKDDMHRIVRMIGVIARDDNYAVKMNKEV
ncbi:MAG: diguanylate cyclase [Clostridia bacterium]|nr:diguanylate cyclase [Clostridia bacterium]